METKDQAPQNEIRLKAFKEVGYSDAVSDLGQLALDKWPKGIPDDVFELIGKMILNQSIKYNQ